MQPKHDPRLGDVESDASSPKQHSLLRLAGSLLVEVSLPKLLAAWLLLIGLPGLLLGAAPIAASIWLGEVFGKVMAFQAEIWSVVVLAALVAVALFSSRRLFRLAEHSFWSLNALAVQPVYAACREALRQLVEGRVAPGSRSLPVLRSAAAAVAGLAICGVALLALVEVWPATRFVGDLVLLHAPRGLALAAFANSAALLSAYVAVASLAWATADATMDQPHDLANFDAPPDGPVWRIVHLSDIHVVGERYGFRIESGRSGPRGNERLQRVFDALEALHAKEPLHAILITGDVTDAGLSTEWAEFFDFLARHPALADLVAIAPGNHDLNIVDRGNPARLDLPMSPVKRLRKLRVLAALDAVQGERARVVDQAVGRLGASLASTLAPHDGAITSFMDAGRPVFSKELSELWTRVFPLALAPERDDGLGVILLNSNAETHFSFTNALGMISWEQSRAIDAIMAHYPGAYWVVGLHHHVVEYLRRAKAISERIGTALINGTWFVRRLQSLAGRVVVMHGHRHIDWVGECGGLRIVSAPSPVMTRPDGGPPHFYVQRLAVGADRRLKLLAPERVELAVPVSA
ncbi:metallophosphoesterase family protein [Rhodoblastus sp.]|uniref:metallophosphoesterase family protein n=1 Tax=Rhodoblastus sp. TaxID=1962975 RepID=UPI003F98426B